jgi:farnesyl diphosphate synthase
MSSATVSRMHPTTEWLTSFNSRLLESLDAPASASPLLQRALKSALSAPGKRLRPGFVFESGALFQLPEKARLHCAIAIESVHLFSLIHDDLPALDNDDFRRGLPTLHREFDEATALLAGDELLNHAYAELALAVSHSTIPKGTASGDGSISDVTQRVFRNFSLCTGRAGMIGGQMLEIELLREGSEPTLARLSEIQSLKTGALFRAAILLPVLLSGETENSDRFIELGRYADDFGFAFQIADDLDDEAQDQAHSRKNILSHLGRSSAIELALSNLKRHEIGRQFSFTRALIDRISSKS